MRYLVELTITTYQSGQVIQEATSPEDAAQKVDQAIRDRELTPDMVTWDDTGLYEDESFETYGDVKPTDY